MMDAQIRRYIEGDAKQLARIASECFPESALWNGPLWIPIQWWRLTAEVEGHEIWVLTEEDRIVGYIHLISGRPISMGGSSVDSIENLKRIAILWSLIRHPVRSLSKVGKTMRKRKPIEGPQTTPSKVMSRDPAKRLWIEQIAVAKTHRGKGCGAVLIEFCLGNCRERGLHYVGLAVRPENIGARRLYEKMGFTLEIESANLCTYVCAVPPVNAENSKVVGQVQAI